VFSEIVKYDTPEKEKPPALMMDDTPAKESRPAFKRSNAFDDLDEKLLMDDVTGATLFDPTRRTPVGKPVKKRPAAATAALKKAACNKAGKTTIKQKDLIHIHTLVLPVAYI
jgi:hypothetical protein